MNDLTTQADTLQQALDQADIDLSSRPIDAPLSKEKPISVADTYLPIYSLNRSMQQMYVMQQILLKKDSFSSLNQYLLFQT